MTISNTVQTVNGKTGAVLVVGGGIGGIQAALDLAESGYYVYLVEKSPAIGGVMAQLDKTFPTNDCSMCILSPKLVECGRHLNIETITCADIMDVRGEPGNFTVRIRKRPRYVDIKKCTSCGECTEVCPVELPSEFEQELTSRKAIFRPFAQAFPNAFSIDKKARAPCVLACPARVNAQGYIALISKGKYREALALIKEAVPLPGVIGRICTHPCESRCNRGQVDEPVAICSLKRFAADQVEDEPLPAPPVGDRVAVIGSGPAGLSCAYYLALRGYRVTIFEALPVTGGMLYAGIPEYRLPRRVLEAEIDSIKRLGVEIKTGTPIGGDSGVDNLFRQGYRAVFVSTGAHLSQRLDIKGEDAAGVLPSVSFLRDINLGKKVATGKHVAVIGGGNVAIDTARCAARLGSEVTILYRRSRAEMPASPEEIAAAEAEGIRIEYLVAPLGILTQDGRVAGIRCRRMQLGEPDASGRRRPVPIPGSEFDIDVDTLIPAIGQSADLSFLGDSTGIETGAQGIKVNPLTLATSREGVFAGGDVRLGPATAIEAIADGKRAAVSIDRYIRGEDLEAGRASEEEMPVDISEVRRPAEKQSREKMPHLALEQRRGEFREVELGFTGEMAVREACRCLNCGNCSECLMCVAACKAEAIDHQMHEEVVEVGVGAVVLAPGFKECDASLVPQYGYGKFSNVITSTEFERILSASGPFQGELMRPYDHKVPQKIAWIQCVGSRDPVNGRGYCSSVCCTYSIKEALVAREHTSRPLDTAIFYMDIRTFGKGFEAFFKRAKEEQGVRFIRCRPSVLEEVPENRNLRIKYEAEDGKLVSEEFDLVVLATGIVPPAEAQHLAGTFGIQLDSHGFCRTDAVDPVATTVPGVFACGTFTGPRDIPETVTQASAAAASASALLSSARNTLVKKKEYPPERDVSGEPPRIGVFVCHCGINIGGVVNVPGVREYAATLPDVVYAEENLYTCSQDTQERIKEKIREHNLNRVVVASCTPRTHEPLFQETIRQAGLNKYLFEMANIRDQCSWVHKEHPEEATEKSKDLVAMAVAKARLIEPLQELTADLVGGALIIGGGITGMTAALELADQGFKCYIVEKSGALGGNLQDIYWTLDGRDVQQLLTQTLERVRQHKAIDVYLNAEIKNIAGYIGNFRTTLVSEGREETLKHGVVIIATGGHEYKPEEYLYGTHPGVMTQRELERHLVKHTVDNLLTDVVMVQCVGSRNEERPYCSRVCCSEAVKNALKIKEFNPSANVFVLYRDMRTYGFLEEFYQEARAKGVFFIRYDDAEKPEVVSHNGKLRVSVTDSVLREKLVIDCNILVLSAGIVPNRNDDISRMLKTPVNEDGFLVEAHVKLRPVDSSNQGIFLCGLAHSPQMIGEAISQAKASASRAAIVLSRGHINIEGIVSSVNKDKCIGCGLCESICAFKAIELKPVGGINKAETIPASCAGCGLCAASCPQHAIAMAHFTDEEITAQIEALTVAAGKVI